MHVHDEQLFAPPRIEGPFAVLTLSPGTGGGARLSSIGYQVNDTRHVFDPAEAVTVAHRDKAAEAALAGVAAAGVVGDGLDVPGVGGACEGILAAPVVS